MFIILFQLTASFVKQDKIAIVLSHTKITKSENENDHKTERMLTQSNANISGDINKGQ